LINIFFLWQYTHHNVIILTNAQSGWVQMSASAFVSPSFSQWIESNAIIISARDSEEQGNSSLPFTKLNSKWKCGALKKILYAIPICALPEYIVLAGDMYVSAPKMCYFVLTILYVCAGILIGWHFAI
jgi:hypothetical protein